MIRLVAIYLTSPFRLASYSYFTAPRHTLSPINMTVYLWNTRV